MKDGAVSFKATLILMSMHSAALPSIAGVFRPKNALPELRGVKGEMLILSCPEVTFNRPIRLLHPRVPLYIVPRGDGVFMLGATMIEGHAGQHVTARALLELLSAAYALTPAFGEAEVC